MLGKRYCGMHSKGQPRLNFDTLRLVCNCLTDVPDVLSFALTCSTLKNDALQRRLQMSPIVLSNPEAVDKFHNFIFADAAARAPHIYGLKLPDFPYNTDVNNSPFQETNDRLVALLEGAIRLEYLYLSTTGLGDPLLATVAKLSSLRELFVCGRYHREPLLKVLTTLRSPLRHLHIEEYVTGDISAAFLHNCLSYFAPTLEILELADFSLDIFPSSMTTQFPAMRSLKTKLIYNFDRLGVLLRLFPNLNDTLVLRGLSANGTDYSAFRERSKEAQKAYTWPGLDHVVCSAKAAFLLALRCPVRRMDLEVPMSCGEDKQYLVEILRHNSPRQLSFRLAVFGGLPVRALDGFFPVEAADKLTHLVIFLSFQIERREGYNAEHNSPWDRFIDTLMDSMKHLCLTHLRIVFQYEVCRDDDDMAARAPLRDVEEDSVYVASEQDLRPAATRFFSMMQTLQCVLLTTCGYASLLDRTSGHYRHTSKWLSSKAWQILGGNEDLHPPDTEWEPCMEISGDEAETILDREELHLGSREQAMLLFCGDSLPE